MPSTATRFANPSTGTTYRFVVTDVDWRITKARDDQDRHRLAHLRGQVSMGPLDAAAVAHLVAGTGGQAIGATNPAAAFAAVVQLDLERTADVAVAIAREADEVYQIGCRGFRPRSLVLRQQRDAALRRATETCRALAAAWRCSGLVATREIPAWLSAALTDAD